jgi:hypothetical protein
MTRIEAAAAMLDGLYGTRYGYVMLAQTEDGGGMSATNVEDEDEAIALLARMLERWKDRRAGGAA